MPYPPLKSEQYQNIGGVNRKASPYMTGTNEVIDIRNLDFTEPGAYTTRPGSTAWIYGSSAMASINAGMGVGSTSNILSIDSIYQFSRLSGASYIVFTHQGNIFFKSVAGSTNYNKFNNEIPTILSFAPFVDYLFIAGCYNTVSNLGSFFKSNGSDINNYSLPYPDSYKIFKGASVSGATVTGMTGIFVYGFAWMNERGYIGPVDVRNYNDFLQPNTFDFPGIQFSVAGASFIQLNLDVSDYVPLGYGISYLVIFRAGPFAGNGTPVSGPVSSITTIPNWYDLQVIGITNSYTYVDKGNTYGPVTATGNTLGGNQLFFTLSPNIINVYNNALFMGGFGYTQNGCSAGSSFGSGLPSTVYFSAIGEPELVGATQSFEVRTNDSDVVTGFCNYISQQMIFKNRSFFSLSGTDSTNYALSQISADYGCISNRAIVTFNQLIWFLDRKGICQYDGANVQIISNREEPIFKAMNLQAAEQTAVMIHVKDRNEIWTAIPINGATFNNYLVIYDYVANAFSEWEGPRMASLGLAFDPNQQFTPIYGNYSGVASYFNATLFTDNGIGYTCWVTPRYFGGQGHEMGYSVEKMFRRAYFDITDSNNTGQTTIVNVNFLSDFGSSVPIQSQTFAMASGHTQSRLDFGIPGKAATFKMWYQPQTPALNFNGYTIEYRFQRNV